MSVREIGTLVFFRSFRQRLLSTHYMFFRDAPAAYRSSGASDWIPASAETCEAVEATADRLIHCCRPDWSQAAPLQVNLCSQVLNPLYHSGNSYMEFFFFPSFFKVTLAAYGTPSSKARGWIGATAASYTTATAAYLPSNPHLWPTPQLTANP